MRSRICRRAFCALLIFQMKMRKDDAIVSELTTATHTTHNYRLHSVCVCKSNGTVEFNYENNKQN